MKHSLPPRIERMTDPHNESFSDAELKRRLRESFDSQIPNYGSYNVVYATGLAGSGGCFLIGYRSQPLECIVAPIDPLSGEPLGVARTVSLTNINEIGVDGMNQVQLSTTTGKVFRFTVPAVPLVRWLDSSNSTPHEVLIPLEQTSDAADFGMFVDNFMSALS